MFILFLSISDAATYDNRDGYLDNWANRSDADPQTVGESEIIKHSKKQKPNTHMNFVT